MKFAVKNRFSGKEQFTAEIEANKNDSESLKLRLAVFWAVESGANLLGGVIETCSPYGVFKPTIKREEKKNYENLQ